MARSEGRNPAEDFAAGMASMNRLLGFPARPGTGLIKASATKAPRVPGVTRAKASGSRSVKLPKLPAKGVL